MSQAQDDSVVSQLVIISRKESLVHSLCIKIQTGRVALILQGCMRPEYKDGTQRLGFVPSEGTFSSNPGTISEKVYWYAFCEDLEHTAVNK